MKTGMIIIHYNDYDSLKSLMDNIKDYKVLDKIIIYDNNSNKDIKSKLKKLNNNNIEVIFNSENKGFSYAINEASKALINEFKECNIIISNSDIIIDKEEDIKELIKILNNKKTGLVAPTIVEGTNLNRGWRQPSPFLDSMMNIVGIHRFFRKKYIMYNEGHYEKDTSIVEVASGCFFLIKSNTLREINYLDDNLFLYYEENVLARKLQVKKKNIVIANNILIIHNHSVSIDKNMKKLQKLKQQKKSQYYFQVQYNDANLIEKILLKTTAFINRNILRLFYAIKDTKK